MSENEAEGHFPDVHHDAYSKTIFGFWLYLLSDFILFGTLFAAYAVLRNSTFGGPGGKELFHLHANLAQTVIFLVLSFTAGMGGAYLHRREKKGAIVCFMLTFVLGSLFIYMMGVELSEIYKLGHSWKDSAYLSAYYSVIGTFGLHVIIALLWTLLFLPPLFKEVSDVSLRRLSCLRMFWQFLNVIWLFIFTIVYLIGGI